MRAAGWLLGGGWVAGWLAGGWVAGWPLWLLAAGWAPAIADCSHAAGARAGWWHTTVPGTYCSYNVHVLQYVPTYL